MTVTLELDGHVGRIVFDRQEQSNVLDRETVGRLVEALEKVAAAPQARVVTLRGAGTRVFCGGYDLGKVEQSLGRTGLEELMVALEALPMPSIAVLGGHAMGAGLEIACRCDLRVVRKGVRVGLPAVRLGVAYRAGGLARILAVAPLARTLLLTGEQVLGEELTGFADVVAHQERLDEEVDALTGAIAKGSPAALAYTARAIRLVSGTVKGDVPWAELDAARAEVLAGDDLPEALAARRERRMPLFRPRGGKDER